MDYIYQTEQIFKFLEFKSEEKDFYFIAELKRKFNNDYNLLGCFIKDFLIVKTSKYIKDSKIYSEFVLWCENTLDDIFDEIKRFSNYYLTIVFENTEDEALFGTIAVINSCFELEAYPILMKIIDDFLMHRIDVNTYNKMLKYLTDIAISKFENPKSNVFDFVKSKTEDLLEIERLAV